MATINNEELLKVGKIFEKINRQNSTAVNYVALHMTEIAKMMSPILELSKFQNDALKPYFDAQKIFSAQINTGLHQSIMDSMSFLSKNSIFSVIQEIPKFDSSIFSILQNDSFKSVFENIKNLPLDEAIEEDEKLFQLHVENHLKESDKKILVDFLDVAKKSSSEAKTIIDFYEAKDYRKVVIAIIFFIMMNFSLILSFFSEDTNYRINRDNAIVRTSPISNNENAITTLKRNIYVEKIDYDKNGWIKIRFEMEDGTVREGWIYRTFLSKIESKLATLEHKEIYDVIQSRQNTPLSSYVSFEDMARKFNIDTKKL